MSLVLDTQVPEEVPTHESVDYVLEPAPEIQRDVVDDAYVVFCIGMWNRFMRETECMRVWVWVWVCLCDFCVCASGC